MAPKAPVHPQVVKDEEASGGGEENVRNNHPQVVPQPADILETDDESDNGRHDECRRVEQEEMPVSHPLRQESSQWCHLAAIGLSGFRKLGGAQRHDERERWATKLACGGNCDQSAGFA